MKSAGMWLGGIAAVAAVVVAVRFVDSWFSGEDSPPGWLWIQPPYEVSELAEQGALMWAGGNEGLFPVDRATGAVREDLEVPDFHFVRALLTDSAGDLWVGHRDGLTRYDGDSWSNVAAPGLPDAGVFALLEDSEGRLWAGTLEGAAVRTAGGWNPVGVDDGLLNKMVNAMTEDAAGGIWFGSYVAPEGGISRLDPNGTWTYFTTDDGVPHSNITSLQAVSDGSVWAGSGLFERGGAARFECDGATWHLTSTLDETGGLPANKVRFVFEDVDGILWLSTEFAGVARLIGDPWPIYTVDDGLTGNEAKAILRDSDGTLWFGTDNGLTRVDQSTLPPR